MIRHRATCEDPDCGRVWRENCADCLRDVADRHRAETGHPIHLLVTSDDDGGEPPWRMLRLTRQAHQSLHGGQR